MLSIRFCINAIGKFDEEQDWDGYVVHNWKELDALLKNIITKKGYTNGKDLTTCTMNLILNQWVAMTMLKDGAKEFEIADASTADWAISKIAEERKRTQYFVDVAKKEIENLEKTNQRTWRKNK